MIRKTVAEEVVSFISEYVIINQIEEGEKLPSERLFSEMIQCGRRAVREAIEILEKKEVIYIAPKKGIFLNNKRKVEIPIGMDMVYTLNQLKEILEFRNSILKEAISIIPENIFQFDKKFFNELTEKIEQVKKEERAKYEYEFQSSLISVCKNHYYLKIFSLLRNTFYACTYYNTEKENDSSVLFDSYNSILNHLEKNKIEIIFENLNEIKEFYISHIPPIEQKAINPIWRYLEEK